MTDIKKIINKTLIISLSVLFFILPIIGSSCHEKPYHYRVAKEYKDSCKEYSWYEIYNEQYYLGNNLRVVQEGIVYDIYKNASLNKADDYYIMAFVNGDDLFATSLTELEANKYSKGDRIRIYGKARYITDYGNGITENDDYYRQNLNRIYTAGINAYEIEIMKKNSEPDVKLTTVAEFKEKCKEIDYTDRYSGKITNSDAIQYSGLVLSYGYLRPAFYWYDYVKLKISDGDEPWIVEGFVMRSEINDYQVNPDTVTIYTRFDDVVAYVEDNADTSTYDFEMIIRDRNMFRKIEQQGFFVY